MAANVKSNADHIVQAVPRVTFKAGKFKTENTQASGTLTLRKHVADVGTFSFFFTDTTVRQHEDLPDAIVSVERDFGEGISGLLAYDVGARNAKVRVGYNTNIEDRDVKIKGTWVQKDNILHAEATVDIDENNSVTAGYNLSNAPVHGKYIYSSEDGGVRGFPLEPPNDPLSWLNGYNYAENSATVAYRWQNDDGWSVQPFYDVARQAAIITVGKRHNDHNIRAAYDTQSEQVGVEWQRDALRVLAQARVNKDGVNDPTVAVTLEKQLEF